MGKSLKKRVLVTGAVGFIGSFAVEALLKRGYAVTILDRLEPSSMSIYGEEAYRSRNGTVVTVSSRPSEQLQMHQWETRHPDHPREILRPIPNSGNTFFKTDFDLCHRQARSRGDVFDRTRQTARELEKKGLIW